MSQPRGFFIAIDEDDKGRPIIYCQDEDAVIAMSQLMETHGKVFIKSPEKGRICPLEPNKKWKDSICGALERNKKPSK